jgi:hypothetical protein
MSGTTLLGSANAMIGVHTIRPERLDQRTAGKAVIARMVDREIRRLQNMARTVSVVLLHRTPTR